MGWSRLGLNSIANDLKDVPPVRFFLIILVWLWGSPSRAALPFEGMCLHTILCDESYCYTEIDSLDFLKGTQTSLDDFHRCQQEENAGPCDARTSDESELKKKCSTQFVSSEVGLKEKAEFGIRLVSFLSKTCRIVLRSMGHYKIASGCSLVKLAGDVAEDHEEYWDAKRKPLIVVLQVGHEALTLSESSLNGVDLSSYTKHADKFLRDFDKNLDRQDRILSKENERYLVRFGFNLAILATAARAIAIARSNYKLAGIFSFAALIEDVLAIGYEGIWTGKASVNQCRSKSNVNLWYLANHATQAGLLYQVGYKSKWLTTAFIVELFGEFAFRELYCRNWIWTGLKSLLWPKSIEFKKKNNS